MSTLLIGEKSDRTVGTLSGVTSTCLGQRQANCGELGPVAFTEVAPVPLFSVTRAGGPIWTLYVEAGAWVLAMLDLSTRTRAKSRYTCMYRLGAARHAWSWVEHVFENAHLAPRTTNLKIPVCMFGCGNTSITYFLRMLSMFCMTSAPAWYDMVAVGKVYCQDLVWYKWHQLILKKNSDAFINIHLGPSSGTI